MINIVRYGSTAENNSWTLPEGMFSQDTEKMSVRVHDGKTPGGFEAIGVRAFTPPPPPGPQELIAGTMEHGFFGETTSEELFTYEALASQIGLSAGTSQFNEESLWLKFALDGNILYVAKKTARYNVSWNHIHARGAVHEGGTQVTVGSHTFDVTLLKGANSDPTANATGYDVATSHGSEWNRLLYHVSSGASATTSNTLASEGITEGSFAQYSEAELLTHRDFGNGSYSWCQEVSGSGPTTRVYRGYVGVSYLFRSTSSAADTNIGWRPCLRLVV